MNPIRVKSPLWLFFVPPLLSFILDSLAKPSGPFAFWIEISIFCLFSLVCGFALAFRNFKTFAQRLWGGFAFSASGLYLISCVIFTGCFLFPPYSSHLSAAQRRQDAQAEELRRREWVASQISPRDTQADSSMLDLSPYYDELLPGWIFKGSSYTKFEKPGTHTWDGIKFDARGMIRTTWPRQTISIPVGVKCSSIAFLLGAYWDPRVVSRFVIHYQNGATETVPILYGTDVSSSQFENGFVPTNAVVWEELTSAAGPSQPLFGFFIKKWRNPFPGETTTSIDYVQQSSSDFLVAITIQPTKQTGK